MLKKSPLIPGFYGKLPILDDFIFQHLPNEFVEPWANWLQHSIAASKQTLGVNWLDIYLACPIWRFALTPGLCGETGWMGVIIPSVDKKGGYFPLTLALPVPVKNDDPVLLSLNNTCYLELEKIALTARENKLDVASIEQLLINISTVSVSTLLTKTRKHKKHTPFSPAHSLWSIQSSDNNQNESLIFKGFPPVTEFSNLLRCRWSKERKLVKAQNKSNNPQEKLHLFNQKYPSNRITVGNDTPKNNRWQSYAETDKGNRRHYNQDAFLDRPDLGLWVVADGMGGHLAGDVASRMIIHQMNALVFNDDFNARIELTQQCLQKVNQTLRYFAKKLFAGQTIGSTVIALLSDGENFAYIWAGDSRVYRLRDQKLEQLSQDHSDESSSFAKKSHVITRAVGAFNTLELDLSLVKGRSGDKFLLCSDGLDNEVFSHEIEHALNNNNYQGSVDRLIKLTLAREAKDNVTVLVVDVL
ncbi:MAG: type VI secretion system-associated protein TagF [Methylococcales bacterium]|nr:type VI secretion system-associated protein TagF [Methylococcales bacterium]